jgi:hypothetical protein
MVRALKKQTVSTERWMSDLRSIQAQEVRDALQAAGTYKLQNILSGLVVIEQAQKAGLIKSGSRYVLSANKGQNLVERLATDQGHAMEPLSRYFKQGLDDLQVPLAVGLTKSTQALVNVFDRMSDTAGLRKAFLKAASEVSNGRMTARQVMDAIVVPGFQEAGREFEKKLDRNIAIIFRSNKMADGDLKTDALTTFRDLGQAFNSVRFTDKHKMNGTMRASKAVSIELKLGSNNFNLAPMEIELEQGKLIASASHKMDAEIDIIKKTIALGADQLKLANDPSASARIRAGALEIAGSYANSATSMWQRFQKNTAPMILDKLGRDLNSIGGSGVDSSAALALRPVISSPPSDLVRLKNGVEELIETADLWSKRAYVSGQDRDPKAQNPTTLAPDMWF